MNIILVGCNLYDEERCVFYDKCNFSPAEKDMETFCNIMNLKNENMIHVAIYFKKCFKKTGETFIGKHCCFKMSVKIIP